MLASSPRRPTKLVSSVGRFPAPRRTGAITSAPNLGADHGSGGPAASRSGIRTCSSLLISVTPYTRAAAFPASRFSRKLPTVPRRVTAPSSADTAISRLSTFGSQESSAATSSCKSSFVMDCLLPVIAARGGAGPL